MLYPYKIFIGLILITLFWLHFIFLTWWFFFCSVTFIWCIYCLWGFATKHNLVQLLFSIEKTSYEHCLAWHTPHHISSFSMSSPSCKIVVLEQIKLATHHLEFHQKCKCLTAYFTSIIDIVRRLPKNWYIICCVYNEPKLHKSV